MLYTLKALYNDNYSSVRVNGLLSGWFNVEQGVKQGCLISPLLFNLYINDLADGLNSLSKGVQIGESRVSLLMYADDIVILAENELDLNLLLNKLHEWCTFWRLSVSELKSKVVHYRPISVPRTKEIFRCGNFQLDIVSDYRYLGFVINENLDYSEGIKVIVDSASRSFGAIVSKCKAKGGMPLNVFSKLYDSLVWPIIDYSSSVWGCREYNKVNSLQMNVCRYYMGVGKYTPNAAIQGDMGWRLPVHRQWLAVLRQVVRFRDMDNQRLNKKVFIWANESADSVNNWNRRVKRMCSELNLADIMCLDADIDTNIFIESFNQELTAKYHESWRLAINQEHAKRGSGRNKLRTYRKLKDNFGTEPYLSMILPFTHRSALAKVRCGVAPINLELGRYRGIPEDERTCPMCPDHVKNEAHILINCAFYDDLRFEMLQCAFRINSAFPALNLEEQFCYVVSHPETQRICAKTCFNILRRRRNLFYT